ncbi:glycosyltransferase [Modestobacter sp. VKM Ac-2984]|uniref:glycosyltransferase n=1 Tax=Modestobacter sp. VKM Ac-2984 TaxID=3004138 RepID=UPI0022AAA673|nr:glycosyltransferase [Modestobacter sp. VKM Ac-2984]MCZ2817355.1 glycosyltransferase [Modestobacter sp. VKM Ac-2984]
MTVPSVRPSASVVIPAHNEAAVIERCLSSLLAGAEPGEWDVVVAANGCLDDTVARVGRSAPMVRCLDLPAAGKVGALRAADEALVVFPRIYLDADVVLSTEAARALRDGLASEEPRTAAPAMHLDLTGCSRPARAYYRVWQGLPVFGPGYVGSGVYAVNEAGHRRLAPWPSVVNDDEYVRRTFLPTERLTTDGHFIVAPARTVRALLRRGRRTRSGGHGLDSQLPQLEGSSGGASLRYVTGLLKDPRQWGDVAMFLFVTIAARSWAKTGRRSAIGWGRDDSSRKADPTRA